MQDIEETAERAQNKSYVGRVETVSISYKVVL